MAAHGQDHETATPAGTAALQEIARRGAALVESAAPPVRPDRPADHVYLSPRAKSALRSTVSSRPPAIRTRLSLITAAARASGDKRPCVVVLGWVIVLLVSPRLAVIAMSRVLSISFHAASRPPLTSYDIWPPLPRCCRCASACCGCDASPG